MRIPPYLQRLMAPQPLKRDKLDIGPEDTIALDLAIWLRAWTLDGSLRAVWFHVANEVGGGGGKRAALRYTIAKAMGFITGTPDYVFIGRTLLGELRVVLVELKRPGGKQSLAQNDFAHWTEAIQVSYALCYSVADVSGTLRRHGILGNQTEQAGE